MNRHEQHKNFNSRKHKNRTKWNKIPNEKIIYTQSVEHKLMLLLKIEQDSRDYFAHAAWLLRW